MPDTDPIELDHEDYLSLVEGVRSSMTQKIMIDNVANYYYVDNPKLGVSALADFPNCAPPFPMMWMEYLMPTRVSIEGRMYDTSNAVGRVGAFVVAFDAKANMHQHKPLQTLISHLNTPQDIRWCVVFNVFMGSRRTNETVGPVAALTYAVDASGGLMSSDGANEAGHMFRVMHRPIFQDTMFPTSDGFIKDASPLELQGQAGIISNAVDPFLLALSLMNCRNVELVDQDSVPEKVRRKRERKGVPVFTHKTLKIEAMRAARSNRGRGDADTNNAFHICRGHFKRFGPENRLFGKWEGTYWWAGQVRGTKSAGVVVKDYEVEAGTDRKFNNEPKENEWTNQK